MTVDRLRLRWFIVPSRFRAFGVVSDANTMRAISCTANTASSGLPTDSTDFPPHPTVQTYPRLGLGEGTKATSVKYDWLNFGVRGDVADP